tara:strand:+ start:213 stop:506 length:294 start_codon:yes stop_codon:yes gene_type:complete
MKKEYIAEIADSIDKFKLYENELNLTEYNETEKKIFWTMCSTIAKFQKCNISDVINNSKLSRSTVYKTILLFEKNSLISVHRSGEDKRQHLITIITN